LLCSQQPPLPARANRCSTSMREREQWDDDGDEDYRCASSSSGEDEADEADGLCPSGDDGVVSNNFCCRVLLSVKTTQKFTANDCNTLQTRRCLSKGSAAGHARPPPLLFPTTTTAVKNNTSK
jgi:hypothetical protein